MVFGLDINDMERHSVDLRLYLDRAKRRFDKAKMPDQFDTIVATILSQSRGEGAEPNMAPDLDTVTIKQVNKANSERLAKFLIHLIEKCNDDGELVLSLQEAIRRSLFECVRRKQPDQPMCFFCSQKLTLEHHLCDGNPPNGLTNELGMDYGLTDEPMGTEMVPSSQVTPPPDEEPEYTTPPEQITDDQPAAPRPAPSTTPPVMAPVDPTADLRAANPKQAKQTSVNRGQNRVNGADNGNGATSTANININQYEAQASLSLTIDHAYPAQPEAVVVKKQLRSVRLQLEQQSSVSNLQHEQEQQSSQNSQLIQPGQPSPTGSSTSTDAESTASVKKAKQEKTITISLDPARIKREFIEQSAHRQEKLNQAVASLVIASNNRSSIATNMANESLRGSPSTSQIRRPSAIIMTPEGPARTKQKRTQKRGRNNNNNNNNTNASPR